jgi:predicted Rossmann fold nucleotide-binding protein DprA/Smf involved in DNA uptake
MNKTTESHILSSDTQAILLLCGVLGPVRSGDPKPLSISEYNNLAQWLRSSEMRPSDLLDEERTRRLHHGAGVPLEIDRVLALLARGASLAFAVESWTNKGLWVISRVDDAYPRRLKDRLKRLAPPILYGSGRKELLARGGLAIVGSRDIDEEAFQYTCLVAESCAGQGIGVVSGGARGVDGEAMGAALKKGGSVVGVPAKGLAQESSSRKFRDSIMEGTLALISPYPPHAAFSVGNAMGRNRYIYALSDWALVVSSALGEGGTWAGATENLKHRWVPLFVRSGKQVPDGNPRLIESGGIPLPEDVLREEVDLRGWLENQSAVFGRIEPPKPDLPVITGRATPRETAPAAIPGEAQGEPAIVSEAESKPRDLFNVVWLHIEIELRSAKTSKELAKTFNVNLNQMTSWLNHAVENGKAIKLTKPVRYVASTRETECVGRQLSLPFKTC